MKSLRIILLSLLTLTGATLAQQVTSVEIVKQTSQKLTLLISGYTSYNNIHVFEDVHANLNQNILNLTIYSCTLTEFGDMVNTEYSRQVEIDLPLHTHIAVNCYVDEISDSFYYNNTPLPDPVYLGLVYCSTLQIDEYPFKAYNIALDDNFSLDGFIVYETSFSYWAIAGCISNTSVSQHFTYIKINYHFWENNAIVKSNTTFLDYSSYTSYGLTPKSCGFFHSLCQKIEFDSVTVDVQYDQDSGSGKTFNQNAMSVVSSNFADLSYTNTWKNWVGSVKNESHSDLVNPKIFACFYLDDKLVQIEETYLNVNENTIQAGTSGGFEETFTPPTQYDTVVFSPYYSIDLTGDVNLPVELSNFAVTLSDQQALLTWTTLSETNNYGFQIERKTDDSEWLKIGQVQGHGTINQKIEYEYIDEQPPIGNNSYRLRQIDFDGTFALSDEKQISIAAPTEFLLSQNYPNPFNASTKIDYTVKKASQVKLIVYNQLGQETMEIINAYQQPGNYTVAVNMQNMASGTYFYRISSISGHLSKTMQLVK